MKTFLKNLLKWGAIVFVGLVVLGMVLNALKSPEEKAAEETAREQARIEREAAREQERLERQQAEAQAIAEMPTVTAQALAAAYEQNTVAADARFKGQRFKVTGVVVSINTDFLGNPYLVLRGGVNQFMEPQFSFSKSDSEKLATLRKGARVTLICTGSGDVAKTPMSKGCRLL